MAITPTLQMNQQLYLNFLQFIFCALKDKPHRVSNKTEPNKNMLWIYRSGPGQSGTVIEALYCILEEYISIRRGHNSHSQAGRAGGHSFRRGSVEQQSGQGRGHIVPLVRYGTNQGPTMNHSEGVGRSKRGAKHVNKNYW